ncbi:lysosome membrane protein 2-like isoform X2 [Penaeus indicus]|uniref:lysosome membrane protein 2-like isoform X2 n=2 Tax=Penaeus indicus TaxID=29960 RepID=UPI00300CE35E
MFPTKQVKILLGIGSILVLLCAIFIGVFPLIFYSIASQMLTLSEDSKTLEAFLSPPVPIYMQFWFFNVTNPDAIRYHGAKPILQEVGPYTYEEKRLKYDLEWNDDEGTVSYLQNKSFIFVPEMSPGLSLEDRVTTLNAIMVSLASKIEAESPVLHALVELAFLRFKESLFITRSVRELIFDGYDEPLLSELVKYTGDPTDSKGKFGFFYPRNNTNDGRYKVKTGALGMDDYQYIVEWKGQTELDYWHGDHYCNMINGTDGSQYPPEVTRNTVLRLYTSELCRSLYLTYEKDRNHFGIHVYRFIPPRDMLEDPLINHDNLCYCTPDIDHCLGAGMLNMAPCAMGAPIVMSTPHFYQGDEVELAKLVGLNPRKEEHETFLDVEPRTGVTMKAAKKIQINIPLKPYGQFPSFKNVPEVIFPILWVNESAVVDEATAQEVRKGVTLPFVVVDAVCGSLIAIGVVLIIVGAFRFYRFKHLTKQTKNSSSSKSHVLKVLRQASVQEQPIGGPLARLLNPLEIKRAKKSESRRSTPHPASSGSLIGRAATRE